MIKLIFSAISCLSLFIASAEEALPIKEWPSTSTIPFVFYISGDGGFNDFSNDVCGALNKAGYPVSSLNSKAYFWNKKTPAESALAIGNYLERQLQNRKNQQVILVGYSFGSDVLPFIVNRLPNDIKSKLSCVVFLAPFTSTDFEIHLSDMIGKPKDRSMDVIAEINRMPTVKALAILGEDDLDFPLNKIRLINFSHVTLPGGHRFDGNANVLVKTMLKYFE
jgi:type IV secretory pathway VirJ component